jgi:hypothetical protein
VVSSGTQTDQGQASRDTVLRGMLLLALMLILVIGGYALFFRRQAPATPTPAADPALLVAMILQPPSAFPSATGWHAIYVLADALPSRPGWQTRYQAARALAYLGSDKVPWADYREMLDEHRQFCNFRTKLPDGRVIIEEAAARQVLLGALKDLATWHAKHPRTTPDKQLLVVYSAVDELAKSPIAELKKQAETTAATLFR